MNNKPQLPQSAANEAGAPQISLVGRRLLVVQVRANQALAFGSSLARVGAEVVVCRTMGEAEHHLGAKRKPFDAALVDGEFPSGEAQALIAKLRKGGSPCLALGVGRETCPGQARALVEAGVVELVIPPLSRDVLLEAAVRCIHATAHLRRRLMLARNPGLELPKPERQAPHWGSASKKPPAHDVDARVGAFSVERGLSPRERSVLRYIALGYRYQDIGSELSISPRTVKMHAANLRRKAGATDRYDLLRRMFAA